VKRRQFITSAARWQHCRSQHARSSLRCRYAGPANDPLFVNFTDVFRSALKDAGYVEGQNLKIDFRWAEGDYTRLPVLAAE
jgi:putative ABC transport system substrate-binding protein